MGKPELAIQSFRSALEVMEKLVRENPEIAHYQSSVAELLYNIGGLQNASNQEDAALQSYQRAVEIFDKLSGNAGILE